MVGVYHTPTEQLCQAACRVTKNCSYYTWYEETTCFLLSSCVDNKPCFTCHTGPRECTTTEPPNTTNHPEDCANPSHPTNGKFLCDEESQECHLVCDPGYVTSGQSSVSCTRSGTWSEDPRGLECEEAVMLVTGGDGGLNQAEVYSSTNSCITSLPTLPDLRQKHTVDYVSGNVLLCGGYSSPLTCLTLEDDKTWTQHSHTTRNRSYHGSAIHKSDLYLVGGLSSTAEVFRHDDNNDGAWDYAWDTREGTDGCMVTTGDSQAIMTGGHGCSKCVYQYNMETGASTQLQNMNEGRSSHGCALYQYGGEEYVLVAGGWDGHHNLRSSEVLSLTTGQWRVVGDLRESKRALQLAVIEGGLVVATGGRVGTVVDTVEIFDTEMEQWREGVALTTRRAYHGVTPVPRSKYCFN